MELACALLCDHAQVRDRLLYVLGGGVNQIIRPTLPSPAGVVLAVVVTLEPADLGGRIDVEIEVEDPVGESAARLPGRIETGAAPPELVAADVPLAFDLRSVSIARYGTHEVVVRIGGEEAARRRLVVLPPSN